MLEKAVDVFANAYFSPPPASDSRDYFSNIHCNNLIYSLFTTQFG